MSVNHLRAINMEETLLSKSFEGFPVDMNIKFMKVTLPPGEYWIGDITKVMDFKYVKIWEDQFNYSDGDYDMGNGRHFVVHGTHTGDGNFTSSTDKIFTCEGGVIGMISLSLMDEASILAESEEIYYTTCGMIRNFKEEVTFVYFNGVFLIHSDDFFLRIYTNLNTELYLDAYEEEEEEEENPNLDEARFISENTLEEIELE